MTLSRLRPLLAFVSGAALVLGSAKMAHPPVPSVSATDRAAVLKLLDELEKECDPDSPSNDYVWSSGSPSTERHRRQIIERLHGVRDATLAEVGSRLQTQRDDEFGEMLTVLAAAMGRDSMVVPAARLMVYSEHPAVRLCAARELAKLHNPLTIEWFEYAAMHDDRCVRNDDRGSFVEFFYPVRTVAEIALKDMGAAN
jgi:hypothetical protein